MDGDIHHLEGVLTEAAPVEDRGVVAGAAIVHREVLVGQDDFLLRLEVPSIIETSTVAHQIAILLEAQMTTANLTDPMHLILVTIVHQNAKE